ncbi:MAG: response regulator, partial [Marinobacter sp.]|nr:response regulator [Marinobacter sp.]
TMAWTVLLLLGALLAVLSLLWVQVIRPLKQLTGFTRKTRRDTFWEQPAQFQAVPRALKTRRDEIGSLARNFQRLLAAQKTRTSNLVKLSHQDPLTGLANRRLYDEKLAQALSQSQLVSVLMLDIDHFKLYNDHFGHQMGDDCLVSLANQMKECFEQPGFVVARTGGEEFSILLPGQSVEDAVQDAERLRKLIKQLRIPHPNSPVAPVVTVSVGVASTANVRGLGPEMLMRRADEALYQAKAEGRDRIKRYAATVIQSSD